MMPEISRKKFIGNVAAAAMAGVLPGSAFFNQSGGNSRIKAIAFDALAIFDVRPIFGKIHQLFPVCGEELAELWRSRQFSYQWIRALGGSYKNFFDVTRDSLDFALTQFNVNLTNDQRNELIAMYAKMNAWPDVIPALSRIRENGLKTYFLSNMTAQMLNNGIEHSNMGDLFDGVMSTDEIRTYKPSRDAYEIAVKKLNLKKEEILFVAFAGWDVAGAKWFGYPVFWANRSGARLEQLDSIPDGTGVNLNDLMAFIQSY